MNFSPEVIGYLFGHVANRVLVLHCPGHRQNVGILHTQLLRAFDPERRVDDRPNDCHTCKLMTVSPDDCRSPIVIGYSA